MEDILLIGGGGHCKSVIDTLTMTNNFNIIGIIDTKDKVGNKINSIDVIGEDKDLQKYYETGIRYAFVTTGSIGDTSLRKKLIGKVVAAGFEIPVIIDPSAIVSKFSSIKSGTFIGKGVIINSHTEVGAYSIINSGAIIEHDCIIEKYCHIAPGTTMSGNVSIGENTHIGTNSTIIQSVSIGSNTLIGAGSVVISDIRSHKKAYGNPCKEIN